MLLYVPLVYQYNFEKSDKDDTGLGIWLVMVFQGFEGMKLESSVATTRDTIRRWSTVLVISSNADTLS